jgi:hypothetical protein
VSFQKSEQQMRVCVRVCAACNVVSSLSDSFRWGLVVFTGIAGKANVVTNCLLCNTSTVEPLITDTAGEF